VRSFLVPIPGTRSLCFLLALAFYQGLMVGILLTVVGHVLPPQEGPDLRLLIQVGIGALIGCVAASLVGHPRRNQSLIPLGMTGLLLLLGWVMLTGSPATAPSLPTAFLLGFFTALVHVALWTASTPHDREKGRIWVFLPALVSLATLALCVLFLNLFGQPTPAPMQLALLTGLLGSGFLLAWLALFPQVIELVLAWILLPMYQVRLRGPGRDLLPSHGPLIIVANHSSYLDPFWIGKVFPGHLRPLMTAAFYDQPLIRWLMVHVVQAIRVNVGRWRGRQRGQADKADVLDRVPELRDAVAALRAEACLLVFPEGKLRRTETALLGPFGQGIWHILCQVPETPVLTIWIEGGWGSWASYAGGPPVKNKKLDWGRVIDVVVSVPTPLSSAVLSDHRRTRTELMQRCLEGRRELGLGVPEAGTEESPSPNAHQNHT
jgi:1-acyl-sn-glycerol-3-phosphate acyltransferase